MPLPFRAALRSATRFVARNPMKMVQMVKHALSMRVALPLDAFRWFLANTQSEGTAPSDVTIDADPPAIVLGASLELMSTPVRASARVAVKQLRIHPDELTVTLCLSDVTIKLIGDSNTPVAGLIKSGALDLSKPGNLVNFMPKRPEVLVEAHDDVVVLDLMKYPKLAGNFRLRRVLETLTPVVNVEALQTDGDFLIVALRATPWGVPRALTAARN